MFSDKLDEVLSTKHHGKCPANYIQPETQQPGECRCRLRGAKEQIIKLFEDEVIGGDEKWGHHTEMSDRMRVIARNSVKAQQHKKLRGES